jgi:septum formation protein
MTRPLLLASGSATRAAILARAGLAFQAHPAPVDEEAIRRALEAEGAHPRDIADTLAELKAARIATRFPDALVLGCDQVLEFQGRAWAKPATADEARGQLRTLSGQTHRLLSALVLYDRGEPVWRHIGVARLTMRALSDPFLDGYLARNWPAIGASVGGYRIEVEGIRLFSTIEGDHFTILGLPLLPLLDYLALRGFIET